MKSVWTKFIVRVILGLACMILIRNMDAQVRATLSVVSYEVNVPYGGPVGTLDTSCASDDLSVGVDWGDRTGTAVTTRDARPTVNNNTSVPPGIYSLYTSHVFVSPGSYRVRLAPHDHCYGSGGPGITVTSEADATAYARIPVNDLSSPTGSLKAGESATLTVTLNTPAPPPGTRVDLTTSSTDVSLPPNITVPANNTTATFDITAIASISERHSVSIKASTVGKAQTVQLMVAPVENQAPAQPSPKALISLNVTGFQLRAAKALQKANPSNSDSCAISQDDESKPRESLDPAVTTAITMLDQRVSCQIKKSTDALNQLPQRLLSGAATDAIKKDIEADLASQIEEMRRGLQQQIDDLKQKLSCTNK